MHDLQTHIAIDLNGWTDGCRPGIFAHRPAPIQISYLGYAGTTGAEFIDYILADETVLPFDQQPFFTEKIVHLPDCYHVNDATRRVSPEPPARRDLGLPDQGLVFCCFNHSGKITATIFDIWMRLLARVPGSVLWLSKINKHAEANLRREAAARGVDPDRLVVASWTDSIEDHLTRHRADLFSTRFPTMPTRPQACLFAGLPVSHLHGHQLCQPRRGQPAQGRGLAGTSNEQRRGLRGLALGLATDGPRLCRRSAQARRDRATCPLFDNDRFCRGIEAAYATMWDIHRRGESEEFSHQAHVAA